MTHATEERLTRIFRDVLDNEAIVLSRTITAADIEEWDSLAHISLLVAIEKDFGVNFTMADVSQLKNVGEMIDLIQRKAVS